MERKTENDHVTWNPEVYHPDNTSALEQIRGQMLKNPIGKYYCSCTNPANPEKVEVYHDQEEGWHCKDRFMDVAFLLNFFKGSPRKHIATTERKATKVNGQFYKGTPENYVKYLEKLDLQHASNVGHKILEALAHHIPRLRAFEVNIKHYKKEKAEAIKNVHKLNKAKDSFIKACEGQFLPDTLKGYESTIDGWIMGSKARSAIDIILLYYSQGWLPSIPAIAGRLPGNRLPDKFGKDQVIKREMIREIFALLKDKETPDYEIARHIVRLLDPFGIMETAGNIRKYFPR